MNQPVVRILHSFLIHKKLFIELFSRAQAGKLDLNVFPQLIAGEPDQVFRQIQDFYRLTHIQDEYFPALGIGARLQHQGNRLRYGHKIADDIRVGHRYRPSGRYLLLKQGNHAAVAAQHITEADGHELSVIVLVKGLYDHFADPLAGPHDIGGVHRFVRGNHDKFFRAVQSGGLRCFPGSEYVVLNRLIGTDLHERHMLMRCRMVDNIRPVRLKNGIDALRIADRSNEDGQLQLRKILQQLLLNIIGIIFINIHNYQMRRFMGCHLTAKLAADGTASAGYHNHFILHIAQNGIQIHADRLSSQKILHLHVTQLAHAHFTVDQLVHARQGTQLTACFLADVQDIPDFRTGR